MRNSSDSAGAHRVARRDLLRRATAGTIVTALGTVWVLSDRATAQARDQTRSDGRPRLPPGQKVIEALKPMGGQAGSPSRNDFKLRVHGAVDKPFELDFRELVAGNVVEVTADVHCVTGWSVLGARWKGVRIADLAKRAQLKAGVRHLILEAAHGYTANVRLEEGTTPDALVTWELDGQPLRRPNGAPVRALVPDLYFWKSAKWLTGLRFSRTDEPGYWEVRGYHNHADPWKEERYA